MLLSTSLVHSIEPIFYYIAAYVMFQTDRVIMAVI